MPNRQQAIIWTNDDLAYWYIYMYASLSHDALIHFSTNNFHIDQPYIDTMM